MVHQGSSIISNDDIRRFNTILGKIKEYNLNIEAYQERIEKIQERIDNLPISKREELYLNVPDKISISEGEVASFQLSTNNNATLSISQHNIGISQNFSASIDADNKLTLGGICAADASGIEITAVDSIGRTLTKEIPVTVTPFKTLWGGSQVFENFEPLQAFPNTYGGHFAFIFVTSEFSNATNLTDSEIMYVDSLYVDPADVWQQFDEGGYTTIMVDSHNSEDTDIIAPFIITRDCNAVYQSVRGPCLCLGIGVTIKDYYSEANHTTNLRIPSIPNKNALDGWLLMRYDAHICNAYGGCIIGFDSDFGDEPWILNDYVDKFYEYYVYDDELNLHEVKSISPNIENAYGSYILAGSQISIGAMYGGYLKITFDPGSTSVEGDYSQGKYFLEPRVGLVEGAFVEYNPPYLDGGKIGSSYGDPKGIEYASAILNNAVGSEFEKEPVYPIKYYGDNIIYKNSYNGAWALKGKYNGLLANTTDDISSVETILFPRLENEITGFEILKASRDTFSTWADVETELKTGKYICAVAMPGWKWGDGDGHYIELNMNYNKVILGSQVIDIAGPNCTIINLVSAFGCSGASIGDASDSGDGKFMYYQGDLVLVEGGAVITNVYGGSIYGMHGTISNFKNGFIKYMYGETAKIGVMSGGMIYHLSDDRATITRFCGGVIENVVDSPQIEYFLGGTINSADSSSFAYDESKFYGGIILDYGGDVILPPEINTPTTFQYLGMSISDWCLAAIYNALPTYSNKSAFYYGDNIVTECVPLSLDSVDLGRLSQPIGIGSSAHIWVKTPSEALITATLWAQTEVLDIYQDGSGGNTIKYNQIAEDVILPDEIDYDNNRQKLIITNESGAHEFIYVIIRAKMENKWPSYLILDLYTEEKPGPSLEFSVAGATLNANNEYEIAAGGSAIITITTDDDSVVDYAVNNSDTGKSTFTKG